MSLNRPLNIFVPHCSDLLTDHRPHGDGLVAHGFIRHWPSGATICTWPFRKWISGPTSQQCAYLPRSLRHKSQLLAQALLHVAGAQALHGACKGKSLSTSSIS